MTSLLAAVTIRSVPGALVSLHRTGLPSLVKLPTIVKLPTLVKLPLVVKVSLVSRLVLSANMAHSVDAKTRSEWIVIGISGVTCGGKTSLAKQLLQALAPAYLFHQDNYFYPDDSPRHVKCQSLPHNNYDILGALDMASFHRDVISTMQGRSKAHASAGTDGREGLGGSKYLVLEGFTVLNYEPINELCDLRYYFVLEYGECASRRALRVYAPPDVAGYFEQCVWPEHLKYRAEIEKDKRVKLLYGTEQGLLDIVLNDIRALTGPTTQP